MRKNNNNQITHAFMLLVFAWMGVFTITMASVFAIGTVQEAEAEELVKEEVVEETTVEHIPVITKKKVQVKTIANALNIREDMSVDSNIKGIVYPNEIFEIEMIFKDNEIDKSQLWYNIIGSKYFVSSEYITVIDKSVNLSKYIKTNKSTYIKELPKLKPVLSKDVTVKSNLTVADMNKIVKGTGLEGQASSIIEVEKKYGINAFFTYAVAALESSYGKSPMARNKNNIFGMNAVDANPNLAYQYNSKHSSILDFGNIIKKYYINQGRTTLGSINVKYSSDTNWKHKVYDIMQTSMSKLNSK